MDLYPACVFDTETTDLPKWSEPFDDPRQPHIVQICAFLLLGPEDKNPLKLSTMIKPELWTDSAPKAFETHGITPLMASTHGRPIKEVMEQFHAEFLNRCVVLAAYGIEFDMRMLSIEQQHLALPSIPEHINLACVKVAATEACKLVPTSKMASAGRHYNKAPKLREAVATLLKREQEHAHDAESDTRDTADLYRYLGGRGLIKPKPQKGAAEGSAAPQGAGDDNAAASGAETSPARQAKFDLPL